MKFQAFLSLSLLSAILFPSHVFSTSIDVSGHITTNTTWSVDTIKVKDTVFVDDAVTLTINPGTHVEFNGLYKLMVLGRLLAIGTAVDTITFTISDTGVADTNWHGIRFHNTSGTNDSSKIVYCLLEKGNCG